MDLGTGAARCRAGGILLGLWRWVRHQVARGPTPTTPTRRLFSSSDAGRLSLLS